MTALGLRPDPRTGFTDVVGIGGIGTGIIFALQENHTLGRNESRMGAVVDARDYCKLHIVEHYIAVLLNSAKDLDTFKIFAVGNVGADTAGTMLLREMKDAGIQTRYVRVEPDSPTMFSAVFFIPIRRAAISLPPIRPRRSWAATRSRIAAIRWPMPDLMALLFACPKWHSISVRNSCAGRPIAEVIGSHLSHLQS